jgi:PAS domain S-box-containing protein
LPTSHSLFCLHALGEKSMEQSCSAANIRVLMVEDTASDAELVQRALKKADIAFTAKRVERQEAFVDALEGFHPDVVLSDYRLPGFTGMAALKLAREFHPEIPVIIVTGALSDSEAVDLIQAGAKDYILKDRLARLGPAVLRVLAMEQGERERKTAEKAMKESEERFRGLATQSALGIAIVDEEGLAYANPRFAAIFGYEEHEIVEADPLDLVDENGRPVLQEMIAPCAGGGHARICNTFKGIYKNGSHIDVEIYRSGMEIGGNPLTLLSVLDITERKRTEDALRKSEEKFRSMFDAMPQGVLMHLAGGRIGAANKSAERILGASAAHMVGVPPDVLPWSLIREDGSEYPSGDQPAAVTLRTGRACHDVVMGVKRPDRSVAWIAASSEPLFRRGEDTPYAAVTTFTSIAAREPARQGAIAGGCG